MSASAAQRQVTAPVLRDLLTGWRSEAMPGRPPSYRELADRVELLVIDGRVTAGSRLPPERELADALQISRTTVSGAYAALRARGLLRSVRGSGSVVAVRDLPPERTSTAGTPVADLSHATLPGWEELPRYFAAATEQLPALLETHALDFYGVPAMRAAIADRYTQRGVPTTPEQVLVTLGAQYALGLILRTFAAAGDRVAVDVPTYPHALDAFRDARLRLVPVPVAESGLDAVEWERALLEVEPGLAYLMPDFQNPTGSSFTDDERQRILAAAARSGTILIADETTAELDIDRPFTAAPLASSRTRATVISIGSASKTLWHGLRVGWIRADTATIDRIAARRPASDLGTPVLEQLVVADVLPEMDRLLATRRHHLHTTRDRVLALLRERMPDWRVPATHGGLCLWVNLGTPVSSALALTARSLGLSITSGPRFGIDGAFERHLRIPITAPADSAAAAVARLADAWDALPRIRRGSTHEFEPML